MKEFLGCPLLIMIPPLLHNKLSLPLEEYERLTKQHIVTALVGRYRIGPDLARRVNVAQQNGGREENAFQLGLHLV